MLPKSQHFLRQDRESQKQYCSTKRKLEFHGFLGLTFRLISFGRGKQILIQNTNFKPFWRQICEDVSGFSHNTQQGEPRNNNIINCINCCSNYIFYQIWKMCGLSPFCWCKVQERGRADNILRINQIT